MINDNDLFQLKRYLAEKKAEDGRTVKRLDEYCIDALCNDLHNTFELTGRAINEILTESFKDRDLILPNTRAMEYILIQDALNSKLYSVIEKEELFWRSDFWSLIKAGATSTPEFKKLVQEKQNKLLENGMCDDVFEFNGFNVELCGGSVLSQEQLNQGLENSINQSSCAVHKIEAWFRKKSKLTTCSIETLHEKKQTAIENNDFDKAKEIGRLLAVNIAEGNITEEAKKMSLL
ncbi:hypothetical protein [uncultured Endozoicomonas sp.]|uniref:hypothetical protein n=1 Tax=uncultured Endozoicomonas sp. TaxID=432652 RepID=UPI002626AF8C|nr:hypothetical protein [uncultured Endozoicomonas sp.]